MWENANEEAIELCNRGKERIYAKKGKGISTIKGEEKRDVWVYQRTVEKRVY